MLVPRIGQRVLERQAHLFGVGIELHDLDLHHIADARDFRRMLDACVRQLAVVNQAIDTAEIDERTEIGKAHDDTLADLSHFERVEQLLLLGLQLFLEY